MKKFIKRTIGGVDWTFVEFYLNSKFHKKNTLICDEDFLPVNIKRVKEHLTETINFMIKNGVSEMTTASHWMITWANPETMLSDEKTPILKISFIPTAAKGYFETVPLELTKGNEIDDLEKQLEIAVLEEDYERAGEIKLKLDQEKTQK